MENESKMILPYELGAIIDRAVELLKEAHNG